jgi:hypothetical protein
MNIFVLDKNPNKCAEYHSDTHLNTLQKELTQMLSTVIWHFDCDYAETSFKHGRLYLPTHEHHPCTRWLMESIGNFYWGVNLLDAFNKEWNYRKGKDHGSYVKCFESISYWKEHIAYQKNFKQTICTPFMQVMPVEYRQKDEIQAYRHYYNACKMFDKNGKDIMIYTNRSKPYWLLSYKA